MTKIKWSDKKIEERINKGVGSGSGKDYKPWIHVIAAGSEGTLVRPKGWKTGRIHQLLSQLEYHTFLAFEWNDNVIDIQEQYPLERNDTEEIANGLGIKHSQYPTTDVNVVMTTDILLTIKLGSGNKIYEAISVKPSSGLEDKRTLEKLEIEKTYWEKRDIQWHIVTEKEIDRIFTQNIEWVHNYRHLDNEYSAEDIDLLSTNLIEEIQDSVDSLHFCLDLFDKTYNLQRGKAITIFRYCLANKLIELDMFKLIQLNKKISELM